jgi:2-keto-4-pentenoate hydratase/2-oxohepta-3-ene-1,7-dioic acid hydratase in catechol pathway
MRLANLLLDGVEHPAVLDPMRGWVSLAALTGEALRDVTVDESTGECAPTLPRHVPGLIATGLGPAVRAALLAAAAAAPHAAVVAHEEAVLGAPFRRARMLWGIGLNYRAHAEDLGAPHPDEPASFIKGDHTIVGPGEPILLPAESERVTAEAELGLIIGRTAWHVDETEALDHVAAVLCVLDQTAEDILQRNPRFLTRSKNFPTFLALGGQVVTTDEVRRADTGLDHLQVSTWHDGVLHREDTVAGMAFGPEALVALHSRVFPLQPGDVISTGTPGAVVIRDGDTVGCRIPGVGALENPVRSAP